MLLLSSYTIQTLQQTRNCCLVHYIDAVDSFHGHGWGTRNGLRNMTKLKNHGMQIFINGLNNHNHYQQKLLLFVVIHQQRRMYSREATRDP